MPWPQAHRFAAHAMSASSRRAPQVKRFTIAWVGDRAPPSLFESASASSGGRIVIAHLKASDKDYVAACEEVRRRKIAHMQMHVRSKHSVTTTVESCRRPEPLWIHDLLF